MNVIFMPNSPNLLVNYAIILRIFVFLFFTRHETILRGYYRRLTVTRVIHLAYQNSTQMAPTIIKKNYITY